MTISKQAIMIKRFFALAFFAFIFYAARAQEHSVDRGQKPNFVIIYADDLGYGDIGCFGAKDIKTPNIDRMAKDGIRFTSFYSASPVCSPSRAALLTGRYPIRMGITEVFFPNSYFGIPAEEITVAEVLKSAGYHTGTIGKWHLGHNYPHLPLQNGFDDYFGIPYSNDMDNVMYMRGNQIEAPEVDQHQITKTYTEEALKFIRGLHREPFFLYVAHNMPHVPIYASGPFMGTSRRGLYGDVVQELDWSVGEIITCLEQLNIIDNTLVIFSSDNGPWLVMRELGGSAGIFREGKGFTFEGGVREPTVAMWRGTIQAGSEYYGMAAMTDWFPTIVNLAGVKIPGDLIIDGKDLGNVLFGKGVRRGDEFAYFSNGQLQAYRFGDWKLKLPFAGSQKTPWSHFIAEHDTLLFNLRTDPGEISNRLVENPGMARLIAAKMDSFMVTLQPLHPSVHKRGSPADKSHLIYLENEDKK
ncbi:MAG TPA: sulfatase [Cyclobacteriaceae bacterium]|nr:sulfatase [Cyclobacteriaceae bacterium]